MTRAQVFAEKLLQIQAVKINLDQPFIWASGWHSPIYCDNRKTLSFSHIRDYIKSELTNMVLDEFPEAEVVAGVATGGIPHGALAADLLRLPFVYVRAKAKDHGLGNQIEGVLKPGQKVVVVEDLVSTGKSSLEAVAALRAAGAEVVGMCALFTYGFPQADEAFKEAGVTLDTISNYQSLIGVAEQMQLIAPEQRASLEKWQAAPAEWQG